MPPMRPHRAGHWTAVIVTLAALTASPGCSDSGGTERTDRSDDLRPTTTESAEPDDPSDTDDPTRFAFGQELRIVEGGVTPALLAADVKRPVVIRNTTSEPQEVLFTNPGWDQAGTTTSGPIPPGGTFELRPIGVVSITYTLAGTDVRGVIQVEDQIE